MTRFIILFFGLFIIISGIQAQKIVLHNAMKPANIVVKEDTIMSALINRDFMTYQGLDYLKDSTQKKPKYLAAKKIKSVSFDGKEYIAVNGIVGGWSNVKDVEVNPQWNDRPSYSPKLISGTWFVEIIKEGKMSLGVSYMRMIDKNLVAYQKDKYVYGVIIHIIKGDVTEGDNYTEIHGSKKYRMKRLNEVFGEYPDIMEIIESIDFSKAGYTQKSLNQFIEVVNLYNEKNK